MKKKFWKLHLCAPIPAVLQTIWARQAGHCWWKKDEFIIDFLQMTPTHRHNYVSWSAKTYIHPRTFSKPMYGTRPWCLVQAITRHTCRDPHLGSWNSMSWLKIHYCPEGLSSRTISFLCFQIYPKIKVLHFCSTRMNCVIFINTSQLYMDAYMTSIKTRKNPRLDGRNLSRFLPSLQKGFDGFNVCSILLSLIVLSQKYYIRTLIVFLFSK